MKLGILHITDVHFSAKTILGPKWESFLNLVVSNLLPTDFICLVVSGDVANWGLPEEYEIAKKYLDELVNRLKKDFNGPSPKIILVPGNHDCNFSNENQIRKNSVIKPDYENLGVDDSVINTCLSVQNDFWEFYKNYNPLPLKKLKYEITIEHNNEKICFHCINTAWMSQKEEKCGQLFYPVRLFDSSNGEEDCSLNISVYHHPTSWFNPNTVENNKREFQSFLDKISSFQIIGHEHKEYFEKLENFTEDTTALHFYGPVFFNPDDKSDSGFQILEIETETKTGHLKPYSWDAGVFSLGKSYEFSYDGKRNRLLSLKPKFNEYLIRLDIPLATRHRDFNLPQVFIFPDVERIKLNQTILNDYQNSENLIDDVSISKCVIEGESQSGKSSLLKMLFLKAYDRGFHPLLFSGKDLDKSGFEKNVKKVFQREYSEEKNDFDRFMQLPRENKFLIIDDFHEFSTSTSNIELFFKNAFGHFSKIIVVIDSSHSMVPTIRREFADFIYFRLKPLGHKKTNDLIARFHKLQDPDGLDDPQTMLEKTRNSYDQVRHILGDKVLPSYPIFLFTIMQSLEYRPSDMHESSYGYCYQTLIHLALTYKANVRNEEIDSYMNFIKELAFFIYKTDTESIDTRSFQEFYQSYSKKFIIQNIAQVEKTLLNSQIFREYEGEYRFSYKYFLYFLVAKYLAENLKTEEGKKEIKFLFENLHIEKYANILVFITYHTKDDDFIDDSIFSSMLPFENTAPITLDKSDPFYQHLNDVSTKIFNDIIESSRHPEEEREKRLNRIDAIERDLEINRPEDHESTPREIDEILFPFFKAFRSIEISGQIIRNRKGSLEIPKLNQMISELFQTGFRTIGYFGTVLSDAKEELFKAVQARIKDGVSRDQVEKRVNEFFQVVCLEVCLGVFSRLIHSVGVKDLEAIFKDVGEQLNTPASKLVSFSINSYYHSPSVKEIKELAIDLKDNFVALQILKARVKSYIYSNYVERPKQQQISEILNMKLLQKPTSKN
jgi:predicted MPP superfamily phosphohydrolase